MKVPYLKRPGEIYRECQPGVRRRKKDIANGKEITIIIIRQKPGYPGEVIVVISKGDNKHFDTNWPGRDVTRFPARIKNAATALRDEKLYGKFRISHYNGTIRIRKL